MKPEQLEALLQYRMEQAYESLREAEILERRVDAGELRRVTAPVSPRLEITEICQRVAREEGPALLFENVEGSSFPLAINLFGSRRRIETYAPFSCTRARISSTWRATSR